MRMVASSGGGHKDVIGERPGKVADPCGCGPAALGAQWRGRYQLAQEMPLTSEQQARAMPVIIG